MLACITTADREYFYYSIDMYCSIETVAAALWLPPPQQQQQQLSSDCHAMTAAQDGWVLHLDRD